MLSVGGWVVTDTNTSLIESHFLTWLYHLALAVLVLVVRSDLPAQAENPSVSKCSAAQCSKS